MMLVKEAVAWIAISNIYVYNYFFSYGFVYVEIDKGILRGLNASTWRGESYFSFKGIPYTKPPLHELRFKDPREETAWAGVRDAVYHGEICPQIDYFFGVFRGQEDCLFVNVYTPSLEAERLPVMVFIHGGLFMLSSANDELYGPDYFMEAGVVLVTFNYRLGALGFLTTEDDDAPGNAGMKDQVAALRWVRKNIAKFGGDPDNVTLFGGSSGAACVHYHILSPMSRGLFARAITQSGLAVNTWAFAENGIELTLRLADALGAKNIAGDTTRAFEYLKAASPEDIVMAQQTLMTAAEARLGIPCLFVPTVEKGVESEEIFLPDSPLQILKSGNFNKVPHIIGYTDDEGFFFLNPSLTLARINAEIQDPERYVPRDIKNKLIRNDLAKLIHEFYFDGKPIANENIRNFANLHSDTYFYTDAIKATKLHLKSSNSPIYFYVFSYAGDMNAFKYLLSINSDGAVHGDELGYLFHLKLRFWKTPEDGSDEYHMLQTMIRLWTNFARYGDPTPPGDPLNWKPVTAEKFYYLNISGQDTELAEDPIPERTNFWTRVYERNSAFRDTSDL